jgi:hypothetical protein
MEIITSIAQQKEMADQQEIQKGFQTQWQNKRERYS